MKNPQFPFFVRDWLCSRKVLRMSGDGVKAYMYLLAESWLQEPRATLPMDDNELASMARVTQEQWQIIRAQVVDCFKVGKCDEHKNCFYNELLLEISRKYENKQRFNNKNAERSQIITEKPISDNDNSISVLSFNSLKEGEEGEGSQAPDTWRDSFEIYKVQCESAFDVLSKDFAWIEEKKRYHPFTSITKSLEKMFFEYWGTEQGWKKKRAARTKNIDWKTTVEKGLSMDFNRVRIPKGTIDEEQIKIDRWHNE